MGTIKLVPRGLFLNTYSVSSLSEIDTIQMDILNGYFTIFQVIILQDILAEMENLH